MILHIPHSSTMIPDNIRKQFLLSDEELVQEIIYMTDMFTDELFSFSEAVSVEFPLSRLVVDVERFSDDDKEEMSKVGMGMIYQKTSHKQPLKRQLTSEEREALQTQYYDVHHQKLLNAVNNELNEQCSALIIDCHSFPSQPLPCDTNQDTPRPPFCVGTDDYHTPNELCQLAVSTLTEMGYEVGVNKPYRGALVPMEFYGKNPKVTSLMIEVSRSLYMNEKTGKKNESFETIKRQIQSLLSVLKGSR
jgi:N-formylglutamate deformylase